MSETNRVTTLFPIAPNPAIFFPSRVHRSVLGELSQAITDRVAVTSLTGPPGCGKSLLLLKAVADLPLDRTAVFIAFPNLDFAQLVAYVDAEVRRVKNSAASPRGHTCAPQYLQKWRREGWDIVLFVDDADQMPTATLKRLLQFVDESESGLQCVLASSGELDDSATFCRAHDLVGKRLQLNALEADEIGDYLNYRIGFQEVEHRSRLEDDVAQLVGELAEGIPQKLHRICEYVMYKARVADRQSIGSQFVRQVLGDITTVKDIPLNGSWLIWDESESMGGLSGADGEEFAPAVAEESDTPLVQAARGVDEDVGAAQTRERSRSSATSSLALSAILMVVVALVASGTWVFGRDFFLSSVGLPTENWDISSESLQVKLPTVEEPVTAVTSPGADTNTVTLLDTKATEMVDNHVAVHTSMIAARMTATAEPITLSESSETMVIEQVAAMLEKAREQIAANQLTLPQNDNAVDTYGLVLELDPGNEAARSGLQMLKASFVSWAQKARQQGDYEAALKNYRKAELIDPGDSEIVARRRALELEAQSVERDTSSAIAQQVAASTGERVDESGVQSDSQSVGSHLPQWWTSEPDNSDRR